MHVKAKQARPDLSPHLLRGLDVAWSVTLNPRGSRGRVAGTADGREVRESGTASGRQREGRGDRLPAPAERGPPFLPPCPEPATVGTVIRRPPPVVFQGP